MVHIRFWFFADDVHILGGRVLTVKKNREVLIVASKEIRLEINVDEISRAEYRVKLQYKD
jgi:hypothetical protein